jgi:N-acetylmuramoyl-L-alanine amidase
MNSPFFFMMIFLLQFALGFSTKIKNPLAGKIICIDPGHGGTALTDTFRVGPSGEREEWINLRVALKLARLLENDGAQVLLTRKTDSLVALQDRALYAKKNDADVFISIHHNAAADTSINFPIIYFHGNASENRNSVKLGEILAKYLRQKLFDEMTPVSVVSDHVIFPQSGTAVLRHSYGIPGVIGEASFFTNTSEELRLKDEYYNQKEAEAYYNTLKEYFAESREEILPKYSRIKLPPFDVFQESERMNEIAKLWKVDFTRGKELAQFDNPDSLNKAEFLISRSIKSLPDSWLAREGHLLRSKIFKKLGREAESDTARIRAQEFYAPID